MVSLRARLLVGLVVLAAAGLAVAAVATYEEQRTFLLSRLNQEVQAARVPVAVVLGVVRPSNRNATSQRTTPPRTLTVQTSGTYGELLNSKGHVLASHAFNYGEPEGSPPAISGKFPKSNFHGKRARLFTAKSHSGSALEYRVAAYSVSGGDVLVVAVPLRDVDQTLHRLTVVEISVGGGVLLALVGLGWLVIGLGLRPLERMRIVAGEIAHGDLSRRVTPAGRRTEVGRLGTSLNEMLGQIESAFEDRRRSEERLRRFLADASHELRTPLTAIRGYAELFRIGAADDPDALARAMGRIESETVRMGTLVEDLLLLASMDELPELASERVDLSSLVDQAANDTRAMAPDRSVTVERPGSLLVDASPDQLRQVLANLSRNAVLHTPAGTAIEFVLRRQGATAVFEVRDHGPGLPDIGDRIFDRFWRSEQGRKRGAAGAGLGLAIVRAIVHAHGGRVSAENVRDGGALFRVELPMHDRETQA